MTIENLRNEINKRMQAILKSGARGVTITERLLVYSEILAMSYRREDNDTEGMA